MYKNEQDKYFWLQVDIWKHCSDFTSTSTSVYHTWFSWFHSTHWADVWNGQRKHKRKGCRLHSSICQTRSKPFWNFDLYYWRTEIFNWRLRDSIHLTVMLVSIFCWYWQYQGHKVISNVWSRIHILEIFPTPPEDKMSNHTFLYHFSKPLNYAIALNELGSETVHGYVGQEPSGRKFNELDLDYNSKQQVCWYNRCYIYNPKGFWSYLTLSYPLFQWSHIIQWSIPDR